MTEWSSSRRVCAFKVAHAVSGRLHVFFVDHIAVVSEWKGDSTAVIVTSNGDQYEVEATLDRVMELMGARS